MQIECDCSIIVSDIFYAIIIGGVYCNWRLNICHFLLTCLVQKTNKIIGCLDEAADNNNNAAMRMKTLVDLIIDVTSPSFCSNMKMRHKWCPLFIIGCLCLWVLSLSHNSLHLGYLILLWYYLTMTNNTLEQLCLYKHYIIPQHNIIIIDNYGKLYSRLWQYRKCT